MDNKIEQFVNAIELADMLGVTVRTILTWARNGMIPALRFSRRVIRFDPAEVEAALRERASKVGKENPECTV